jgi:hypothetical protein
VPAGVSVGVRSRPRPGPAPRVTASARLADDPWPTRLPTLRCVQHTSTPWRSRIVGHAEVAPADLVPNPRNWRTHPTEQQRALAGALARTGWPRDAGSRVRDRSQGTRCSPSAAYLRLIEYAAARQSSGISSLSPGPITNFTPRRASVSRSRYSQKTYPRCPSTRNTAATSFGR